MNTRTTSRFDKEYGRLPAPIRKQVDKQLVLLVQDLRYPSLHAKKYDESRDIWQARVNARLSFVFSDYRRCLRDFNHYQASGLAVLYPTTKNRLF